MPRASKNTGRRLLNPLLLQAQQAESDAKRELRLFRRVAMTAAAELAAAFEKLGAARARLEAARARLEAVRALHARGRK